MKLKVGMYVSTTDRKEIGKITHFCECEYCKERGYLEPVIDNPNIFITLIDMDNKFHGYKFYDTLMDLIQVGDYVNGSKVIDISMIGKDKEKWVWVEEMEDTDNKYSDDYVGYNNDQINSNKRTI